MHSKLKTCLSALAVVGLSFAASALTVSKGEVKPGEWNSNYEKVKAYANAKHVPMVLFWASSGCSMCEKLEKALGQADFLDYQAKSGYVYCFVKDNETVKAYARNSTREYPYIVVYWDKGDGSKLIESRFTGRNGKMPSNEGSKLQVKFMNSVELALTGKSSSPGTKDVPGYWQKARTLEGIAYDANVALAGALEIKFGKANSKTGVAKVSASVTILGEKKKKLSAKVSAFENAFVLESKGWGTLNLTVDEFGYTGTLKCPTGTYQVKSYDLGGNTEVGPLYLHFVAAPVSQLESPVMNEWLPENLAFQSQGAKWTMPSKGTVKWDRKENAFVTKKPENPCGLKLSYKAKTGEISGSYKTYLQVGDTKLKSVTTKVTGYVLNGVGYAVATGKGLTTAVIRIDDQPKLK